MRITHSKIIIEVFRLSDVKSKYRLDKTLFSREEIDRRVGEIAAEISRDYAGRSFVVVGILTGAVVFMTDLVRHMPEDADVMMDFMSVSSYGDSTDTSGVVRILHDLKTNISGLDVIIVEDIVDSGLTLKHLTELLLSRKPASIKICALLDKAERRRVPVKIDYCGFRIPDTFVVGYGLDCAGMWRHLPEIRNVSEI